MFIGAARAAHQGAAACNLRNDVVDVADFVELLRTRVDNLRVTYAEESPLPFPADLDDSGLWRILGAMPHTPLVDAVDQTLDRFKELLAGDRVDLSQLEN
jgi:hypothetical protein